MIDRKRIAVAALAFSAAAFVGRAVQEGYTDTAVDIGDGAKTIGHGTTRNADGSPVKLGDRTTPTKALVAMLRDVNKFEGALKKCVHVPLYQHEYDEFVAFSYNVGSANFCGSTMVKLLNAEDYTGACDQFPRWYRSNGRDCRIRAFGCYGIVLDREKSRLRCLGKDVP